MEIQTENLRPRPAQRKKIVENETISPEKKAVAFKVPEIEEESRSLLSLMTTQFSEHKMAVAGLIVILAFVLIAVLAPVIEKVTGLNPEEQNVFNRYKAPFTESVLDDSDQESKIESYIDAHPEVVAAVEQYIKNNKIEIATIDEDPEEVVFEFMSELKNKKSLKQAQKSADPMLIGLLDLKKTFKKFHFMGTDELGRDVFIRLVYGTRVSIGVGLLVAFASALIGLIIGAIAGVNSGSFIDSLLMRITDSLLSLPTLPLMIVFTAVDLSKVDFLSSVAASENQSVIKLCIILCLFSWMTVARLVRGSILTVKEREFVLAAKTMGASTTNIILVHMVPNIMAPLLVAVTLNIGSSILSEAALSFLGLGIQPPTPSWGNMLFNATEIIQQSPSLAIFPGLLIFIVVISFNYVGDGLQHALDPKAIKR